MVMRRATCSCGQLQLSCAADPIRVSVCHCLACQQRTGSAFGVQARFRREVVAIEGRSTTFVRIGDSGGEIAFHFCPVCASTVFWEIPAMPDYLAIAVGSFAEPSFPAPTVSIYEARQHPWTALTGADIEHLD